VNDWLSLILNLDDHLRTLSDALGGWTLVALAAVIFCETGLVIMPFLPGDSLLFAAGGLSALRPSVLPIHVVIPVLLAAAVVGDAVNFEVGRRAGVRVEKWLSRRKGGAEQLARAREFFGRHGGKAIIMARFVPLLRTFVPFVSGIADMPRARFTFYNVVGGVLWVVGLVSAGYIFGNLPVVQRNFHYVIFGIIFVSVLPVLFELLRAQKRSPVLVSGPGEAKDER
jgi:membrane-associated protein